MDTVTDQQQRVSQGKQLTGPRRTVCVDAIERPQTPLAHVECIHRAGLGREDHDEVRQGDVVDEGVVQVTGALLDDYENDEGYVPKSRTKP